MQPVTINKSQDISGQKRVYLGAEFSKLTGEEKEQILQTYSVIAGGCLFQSSTNVSLG